MMDHSQLEKSGHDKGSSVRIDIRRQFCYSCRKSFNNFESFKSHHCQKVLTLRGPRKKLSDGSCQLSHGRPINKYGVLQVISQSNNNNNLEEECCFESEFSIRVQCLVCSKIFGDVKSLLVHLNKRRRKKITVEPEPPPAPNENPVHNVMKVDQIMSKYRPILPAAMPPTVYYNPIVEKLKQLKNTLDKTKSVSCSQCSQRFHTVDNLNHHLQFVHSYDADDFPTSKQVNEDGVSSSSSSSIQQEQEVLHINALSPPAIEEEQVNECPPSPPSPLSPQENEDLSLPPQQQQQQNSNDDVPWQEIPNNYSSDLEEASKDKIPENPYAYIPKRYRTRKMKKNLTIVRILETAKKRRQYPCSCGRNFTMRSTRDRHAVTQGHDFNPEEDEGSNKCRICDVSIRKQSLLRKHFQEVHPGEKTYKCVFSEDCTKSFWQSFDLKAHASNEHSILIDYHCLVCSTSCLNHTAFRKHMESHKEVKEKVPKLPCSTSFICRLCPGDPNDDSQLVNYKNRKLLREHFIAHHPGEKSYKCSDCDRSYWSSFSLNLHSKASHEDPSSYPHKCTYPSCDKSFIHPHALKQHLRLHTGETPYLCSFCGTTFKSNRNRIQHMRAHEDKFPCHICQRVFNSKTNLNRHLKLHLGIREFLCSMCPNAFAQKIQLDHHMVMAHGMGDCDYPCLVPGCGKKFKLQRALNVHSRRVHGEKIRQPRINQPTDKKKTLLPAKEKDLGPVKCPECDKEFMGTHRLNQHITKIHRVGSCQCPTCDKLLATPASLTLHMKVHKKYPDGTKFVCEICSKEFTQKRFLTRHIRFIHEKKKTADDLNDLAGPGESEESL